MKNSETISKTPREESIKDPNLETHVNAAQIGPYFNCKDIIGVKTVVKSQQYIISMEEKVIFKNFAI